MMYLDTTLDRLNCFLALFINLVCLFCFLAIEKKTVYYQYCYLKDTKILWIKNKHLWEPPLIILKSPFSHILSSVEIRPTLQFTQF